MKNQQNLFSHYEQLLNLTEPWEVSDIKLDADNMNLTIKVETATRVKLPCPVCGKLCAKEDHREERSWRHLDTMQFKTIIICRCSPCFLPRSRGGNRQGALGWRIFALHSAF